MDPIFVVAAVRAAIRIGRTAADAFEQHAQEKPILIPDIQRLKVDDPEKDIRELQDSDKVFAELLETDPQLKRLWKNRKPTKVAGAKETVFVVAMRYRQRRVGAHAHLAAQASDEIAGGIMVGQWAEGKGPVTPWVRVTVALADVALEYVGTNPQILGIGGDGEKLIGAIAAAIAEAIPDGEDRTTLGPEHRFAERLAALVLQSGLKTLVEKPELVFSEDHLKALLKNTLPPLIKALPSQPAHSIQDQVEWRRLMDAFLGPTVEAALGTLAQHPEAFFGKSFAPEKAAGVMIVGLLKAAQKLDEDERFTREALFSLFNAAIKVAAENPALVLGDILNRDLSKEENRDLADQIALDLFASVTKALKGKPAPFGEDLGMAIAVAVLEGIRASGPAIFSRKNPWEKVAGDMTGQIIDGMVEALEDQSKSLEDTVFTKARLTELARVFIAQVAASPQMLISGNQELKRVVSAVASAMAKDERLLLTSSDWTKVAGVAAQEAALNPGRLFGLSEDSAHKAIAAEIIGRLLRTAGDDLVKTERPVGPVMIGETLREAIIVTLRAIGGNVASAAKNKEAIDKLATALNEVAARQGLSFGGKEWLRLFRALLPTVVASGQIPELGDAKIADLLAN